jgi:hypothetical protein
VASDYFGLHSERKQSVVVNELVPLREGRAVLERELILKALHQCGSARNAAGILGMDLSTGSVNSGLSERPPLGEQPPLECLRRG